MLRQSASLCPRPVSCYGALGDGHQQQLHHFVVAKSTASTDSGANSQTSSDSPPPKEGDVKRIRARFERNTENRVRSISRSLHCAGAWK